MNTNARIGLCALVVFFLTYSLLSYIGKYVYVNVNVASVLFLLLSCITAAIVAVILFITKSKSSTIEKQIDGTTVILLYILSFFIPLAGFIVGAIYASKEEEHYKHVGKNCLIFSVMNIILGFIMIVAILGSV